MTREPTNSLILTKLDQSLLADPQILADLLVSRNFNVELVFLPKFARYIIICASSLVALHVQDFLSQNLKDKVTISYSIKDNRLEILEDHLWLLQSEKGDSTYLELPLEEGTRRFLILPPLSPHTEWSDYGKEEEGPNKKAVYSPEELSHLLWDRFGGFESSTLKRFNVEASDDDENEEEDTLGFVDISNGPEVLFEDIHSGVPAIVVDSVKNQKKGYTPPLPKTAMPPQ
ncbi:CIC11C00000001004 [Sungouiella intermedia]|uniref:CIC11C00000001004 n=1 Tax=Sungouiella intermedia TaxID=45354 RepID=A0A1L0BVE0_9ASCO|nr:CIC11C00000001004 [[Candida] intermedia]